MNHERLIWLPSPREPCLCAEIESFSIKLMWVHGLSSGINSSIRSIAQIKPVKWVRFLTLSIWIMIMLHECPFRKSFIMLMLIQNHFWLGGVVFSNFINYIYTLLYLNNPCSKGDNVIRSVGHTSKFKWRLVSINSL